MNGAKDLSQVIESNLCIGCGACLAVDPELRLVFSPQKMMYEPSGPSTAAAAAVCPAVQVDFDDLQSRLFPGTARTPVGVVKAILLAQSRDYERNMSASSGGIIKELLIEYLNRAEVDGVIALQHVEGLLFEPQLLTHSEEIDRLPGSIYHNVPFHRALEILRSNQGQYVLVANPCQLEGILNYIFKFQPELMERIYTTVGLICGWTYTHHAIRAICEFKGADFDRIQDISYRGSGPVGKLRLHFPEQTLEVNRRSDFDYIVAFERDFNIPRCHLCINHINFLAEIVVGDAWLASTAKTKTGVSIVICRTEAALKVIKDLEQKGYILTTPAGEGEIAESQGRRFTYGDFSYAYKDFLKERGAFCPEMGGPNRPTAKLVSRHEVRQFHRQNRSKMQLQQQRNYRALWRRKVLMDLPRYGWRFFKKVIQRLYHRIHPRAVSQSAMGHSVFR